MVRTLPSSRLESYTVTANSLHYSTERTRNRRICIYKGCLSRVLLMQGGRLNRSLGSSRSATELRPLVVPNCTRGIYDPRSGFNPCRAPATFDRMRQGKASVIRVERLPWAHSPRLQPLHPFLLTTNVSNKSGNLLFAQR